MKKLAFLVGVSKYDKAGLRNQDYADNESMRLFIRRKFGREAEQFVEHWLKGEQQTTV